MSPVLCLLLLSQPAPAAPAAAAPAKTSLLDRLGIDPKVDQTLTANNIDIDVWTRRLKRLGLTLPVDVSGVISGTLRVRVPVRGTFDAARWRLDGTITSPKLTVEGVELYQVDVRVGLKDGVLTLRNLSLAPSADAVAAPIRGQATLPVSPTGPLTVTLDLTKLRLETVTLPPELAERFGPIAGTISGRVTATAPPGALADPAAWTGQADVTIEQLTAAGQPPVDLAAIVALKPGQVDADVSRLRSEGIDTAADLTLGLAAPLPLRGTIDGVYDLDTLLRRLLPNPPTVTLRGPLRLAGPVAVDLQSPDLLSAVIFNGTGQTEAAELDIAGYDAAVAGTSDIALKSRILTLTDLDVAAVGGTVRGTLAADLNPPEVKGDSSLDLTFDSLAVERILDELGDDIAADLQTPLADVRSLLSTSDSGSEAGSEADVVSGRVAATVAKSRWAEPDRYAGRLDLNGRITGQPLTVTVRSEPAEQVAAIELKGVDLARLAARLPERLRPPVTIGGRADLVARAGRRGEQPWNATADLTARSLQVDQISLGDATARYVLSDDRHWATIDGQLPQGRLTATAEILREAAETARVTAKATQVDLQPLAALANPSWQLRGLVDADLQAVIPVDRERRLADLEASGKLSSDAIQITSKDGRVDERFTDLDATLQLAGGDGSVQAVAAGLDGTIRLSARGRRESPDADWLGRARLVLDAVVLAETPVESATLEYALAADRHWARLVGTLADGQVDLTAEMPRTDADAARVQIKLQQIGLSQFAPVAARLLGDDKFAAEGRIDADLRALVPLDRGDATWVDVLIDDGQIEGTASATAVAVQQTGRPAVAIEEVNAELAAGREALWVRLSGRLFDGTLDAVASRDRTGDAPLRMSVKSDAISIGQALATVDGPPRWQGRIGTELTAAVPFADGQADWSRTAATGPVRLRKVRLDNRLLTTQMDGVLAWTGSTRRIEQLNGSLGGGVLTGSIALPVPGDDRPQPWRLSLQRMQPRAVSRFLQTKLPIDGPVDVVLQGTSGDVIRATGRVVVAGGQLGGGTSAVRFSGLRLPVRVTYQPELDRLSARLTGSRVSVARGSVRGNADVTVRRALADPQVAVDTDLQLSRLALASLAPGGSLGGTVSGTVTLKSSRVRTINDLSGAIRLTMSDPSSGGRSVTSVIAPYLGSQLKSFSSGSIEATLAGGVLNLRRLTLTGPQTDVYATGTVAAIGSGAGSNQLDLDVVAATGQPEEGVLRSAIVQRAITVAAPGVGILLAASEAVRDRVVHLQVRGTLDQPQVSVKPLETAREASLRFVIRSAVGG